MRGKLLLILLLAGSQLHAQFTDINSFNIEVQNWLDAFYFQELKNALPLSTPETQDYINSLIKMQNHHEIPDSLRASASEPWMIELAEFREIANMGTVPYILHILDPQGQPMCARRHLKLKRLDNKWPIQYTREEALYDYHHPEPYDWEESEDDIDLYDHEISPEK